MKPPLGSHAVPGGLTNSLVDQTNWQNRQANKGNPFEAPSGGSSASAQFFIPQLGFNSPVLGGVQPQKTPSQQRVETALANGWRLPDWELQQYQLGQGMAQQNTQNQFQMSQLSAQEEERKRQAQLADKQFQLQAMRA